MYQTNNIHLSNEIIISKKIGTGAFGEIYQARNTKSSQDLALKIENKDSEDTKLLNEHNCYKLISGERECNILVLDLFGKNLEELFDDANRQFSMKTVYSIGHQMVNLLDNFQLKRVKKIHCRHLIHRDLKPENFMIGHYKHDDTMIHLIDFGLSKRFRNEKTGEHLPYKDNKSFIGNARFSSIYAHLGIEQSRRDDLISLSYILLYFTKGSLPWQGLKCKTIEEKNKRVLMKKIALTADDVFADAPNELLAFHNYCCNLQFDEKPDYEYLKLLMMNVAKENQFVIDTVFDWHNNNSNNKTALVNNSPIHELRTHPNTFSDENLFALDNNNSDYYEEN